MKERLIVVVISALIAVAVLSWVVVAHAEEPGWKSTKHADSSELSIQTAGGQFGMFCGIGGCTFYISPKAGCVNRSQYPVLFNSSRRVGIIPGRCATLEIGTTRQIIVFPETKSLLQAVIMESDLSIAFPEQQGGMSVLIVPMTGASEMARKIIPVKAAKVDHNV